MTVFKSKVRKGFIQISDPSVNLLNTGKTSQGIHIPGLTDDRRENLSCVKIIDSSDDSIINHYVIVTSHSVLTISHDGTRLFYIREDAIISDIEFS